MTAARVVGRPRLIGALYLLLIACGLFAEFGVRAQLVTPGHAARTAAMLREHASWFRLGIAGDVVMLLCDVTIAVLLLQLLRKAGPTLALLAAAMRLVQAGCIAASLMVGHAALRLVIDANGSGAASIAGRDGLALWCLDVQAYGYDLGLAFFGVANLLIASLLRRYRRSARTVAAGLALAGIVYLVGSAVRLLVPEHLHLVQPLYVVPLLAEVAFAVWLLTRRRDSGTDREEIAPTLEISRCDAPGTR